jgi:hypothetical protein
MYIIEHKHVCEYTCIFINIIYMFLYLYSYIHTGNMGTVGFEDFLQFLSANLMHLVREKYIRQLQVLMLELSIFH